MDMKAINHVMQEKLHDFIGLSAGSVPMWDEKRLCFTEAY